MRKIKVHRKDTKTCYHPRSRVITGTGKPQTHSCIICRHIERETVERRYLEGWRIVDIMTAHPWIHSPSTIYDHLTIIGLRDAVTKKRELDTEELLERIIRAGLPGLDGKSVYPRDMIEAIKALNELKGKARTNDIWKIIQEHKDKDGVSTSSLAVQKQTESNPG